MALEAAQGARRLLRGRARDSSRSSTRTRPRPPYTELDHLQAGLHLARPSTHHVPTKTVPRVADRAPTAPLLPARTAQHPLPSILCDCAQDLGRVGGLRGRGPLRTNTPHQVPNLRDHKRGRSGSAATRQGCTALIAIHSTRLCPRFCRQPAKTKGQCKVFDVNRFYPKTQLSCTSWARHSHCDSADPLTDWLEVCCVFYRPGSGGSMCVVWWWISSSSPSL